MGTVGQELLSTGGQRLLGGLRAGVRRRGLQPGGAVEHAQHASSLSLHNGAVRDAKKGQRRKEIQRCTSEELQRMTDS